MLNLDVNLIVEFGWLLVHNKPLRFEKSWLTQSGFLDLLAKWWLEHHHLGDFGTNWQINL
jgi:hypothetical protein